MIHQDGLSGAVIDPQNGCKILHLLPLPCCRCWAGGSASQYLRPENVGGTVLHFVHEACPLLDRPEVVGMSCEATGALDHLVDRILPVFCDWPKQQESCGAVSP